MLARCFWPRRPLKTERERIEDRLPEHLRLEYLKKADPESWDLYAVPRQEMISVVREEMQEERPRIRHHLHGVFDDGGPLDLENM